METKMETKTEMNEKTDAYEEYLLNKKYQEQLDEEENENE